MNLVVVGLFLVILSALIAYFNRRWSSIALLGMLTGAVVAALGLWPRPAAEPVGTILASDRVEVETKASAAAPETPAEEPPAANPQTEAAAPQTAPAIPEHVLGGEAHPWVAEVKALTEKPNHFPLAQSGTAPPDAPNAGDRIYEYVDIQLGGRTFQTVFLSKNPDDPGTWMVHLEPGAQGPPIQPEELGRVRILGEGGNFLVFKIEDGPFAGNFLVWATGGHRGGGEAVRVYSPAFLEREHGLAQQIARAAGE
ncbi:MAG TPA: hypothetical protein ENK37_08095 [Oceanithermus profundus]|uniref:Uncharacterized protein n=1 Tax=Oceanithermus profundus TaxID=187137 RepID=A0A7C4Z647_9DEIN|nr:hypothetical protein [Oceanithermus profundus]